MIKKHYSIIPIGDGYHYLCKSTDGKHFLQRKDDDNIDDDTLFFTTENMAYDYIQENLEKDKYEVEPVWLANQ